MNKKGTAKKERKYTEEKDKPRYNESEIIQTFLNSNDGITFLIDKAKEAKLHFSTGERKRASFQSILDEVIDFYATWSFNCPIRRNNKFSQYKLIKKVEDHCEKPEIKKFFDYLFID